MKLTSNVRDEPAHARWKSRPLLAVVSVSISFGVGETNCSQGTAYLDLESLNLS